ncbi:MAG TPA: metallophosphoesterase [Candidatus Bathyarchaeia archaeon]|nr:metallophosphoesterase [Candidatus Bathyarchaeia archaeon]
MDLVFSDIHADISALETILGVTTSAEFTKKYGTFSRIINLGDVLERGTSPREVLARLKSLEQNYPLHSVMGNHDEGFLDNKMIGGSSIESMNAHAKLDEKDLSFFKQNKDGTFGKREFIDKKNGLFCVHGGPLDPDKIMPKNARDEAWLYQRSWQRLSDEEFEYFSYYGYHYTPRSAFDEAKSQVQNHIILCGHQHIEEAIMQDGDIHRIYPNLKPKREKISNHILQSREINIDPSNNYLIRLGVGGPEGYYGVGEPFPHFGIVQHDPKKVILFTVLDNKT